MMRPRTETRPWPARPVRRTFDAEYKLPTLAAYEAAEDGAKGAITPRRRSTSVLPTRPGPSVASCSTPVLVDDLVSLRHVDAVDVSGAGADLGLDHLATLALMLEHLRHLPVFRADIAIVTSRCATTPGPGGFLVSS